MVAGVITDECTVAVSAERLWKACFGNVSARAAIVPKACAGFIDAVEVEGDGGAGTVTTMKFNAAVGEVSVVKSRTVSLDEATFVMRAEVIEGGKVTAQLKSQVNEVKVEAAGEGVSVVKVKVEYDTIGDAPLPAEDQARLTKAYLGLVKKVEAYLAAHPDELA
ncbi:hypothetical protein HU200_052856 [Digitaria exilis]|uniref:Bet v I/Major latex protein domain-containing protein n=1 Tax=Digitaria exilis TaxID=1010633 RepID=A0A835AYF2_9POAL|nr:hypothetical protein HU200_052856 [Digitaria exilis]CAB3466138.1 unnamed protein product [Digitaria exilis]